MCCEQVVNGKHRHGSMAVATKYTGHPKMVDGGFFEKLDQGAEKYNEWEGIG